MNIHRRPVGRARILAALGAVVVLVGCVLRWWTVGGENGLPQIGGNAFDGLGIVVFVVALVTIAVVTLPYATDRPVSADRWPAYALLATVGWVAFVLRIVDLASIGALAFPEPIAVFTNGPGLWVTGVGLAMLARAAYDIHREPGIR
ncbi:MAG: hypothetical protein HYX54_02160 [Chloroflexi bacterium]|nr:hypothetical protein [Chloroflexota bacterium]